jgi:hypothetical protein
VKPARIKRLIRRDVEGWRGCLGLGEWTLALNFEPMPKRMGKHTVASCTAIWEQKNARLTFDVERMAKKQLDRDEIRRTVLHEMLHCVCNGYERFHETPLLEEMVSTLTTITMRCWKAPAPKE